MFYSIPFDGDLTSAALAEHILLVVLISVWICFRMKGNQRV